MRPWFVTFTLPPQKWGCEIVNSAQRHQRRRELPGCLRVKTSLIGIQCISMGPGPVMLHIFMNSSSTEVWRGKQGIGENRVQFTVWVLCPLFSNCPGAARFNSEPSASAMREEQDGALSRRANSHDSPLIAKVHMRRATCEVVSSQCYSGPPRSAER